MRRARILALAAASTGAILLALPGSPGAGVPPNRNDPCSREGKNVCGTLGVGFYENYRYGIRWFGDYRGALPGKEQTFCIDLRYWYPSKDVGYEQISAGRGFANRDGEAVSVSRQRRMAYAVWTYGRSDDPDRQAAMMLYVHSLMGDGEPGETDPKAISPAVASHFEKIDRAARRFHGPYRIDTAMKKTHRVGKPSSATIRVLSASGAALPDLSLVLKAEGAEGAPRRIRTDGDGVATITFTPTRADGVRLRIETPAIASTLPELYTATSAAAKRNGQRLVAPASQVVTRTVQARVAKTQIAVSTTAVPKRLLLGEPVRDTVVVTGATPSWRATIDAAIYGPFRSERAIRCDGTPAWRGTFVAAGPGTYRTEAATPTAVGWYTYQEVVPGDDGNAGLTTPCRAPTERFRVETQPAVKTQVSQPVVTPGTAVTDKVVVTGLAGETVTVNAALYGPFGSRKEMRCDGTPVWSGTFVARGDGEYTTEPYTPTVPGIYTYREWIDATEFTRAAVTECGEAPETFVVVGQPRIETRVSDQQTGPGREITDTVVVTGLAGLVATVEAELYGPFATRQEIACTGKPYWKGSFRVRGDGTYRTAPVKLDRVGYYTYRERIRETPAHAGYETRCGEVAETTLVRATPSVTTVVSAEVVFPGGTISDRIRVTGLGRTPATIEVELFGPFATREEMRCTGKPYWTGTVEARGDGELRSAPVKVVKAGFYTYRERIAGSELMAATETECGLAAETALARPEIHTGRGDTSAGVRRTQAGPRTPARIRLESLGIDAPVAPAGIDVAKGVLDAPTDIRRAGWWRDGALPGAKTGATLIAGHVDNVTLGAGAFYRLGNARRGDRIQVVTSGGATIAYRVVSVHSAPKDRLPADVYSLRGKHRLVLVTCGGPFDESRKTYRDNVVVTAVRV